MKKEKKEKSGVAEERKIESECKNNYENQRNLLNVWF